MQEGRGVMTFKSGKIYEGEFCRGKKHGNGKMTMVIKYFF